MIKKLEDIKVNNIKRLIKVQKEDIVVKDIDNHNPTFEGSHINNDSKYEFLKKKNNDLPSIKRLSETPRMPSKRSPLGKILSYMFIASVLIGIVYLLSTVFFRANVLITAKNNTFELKHLKLTAGKVDSNVPFELAIVSDKEERDVVFTNSKEVSIKATGEITLYNEFSPKIQKITAGSFISDDKGVSYKTNTTVSIPGYTLDSSKKIIPGQVTVGITAFLPGEAYNSEEESFTITAFKGTDKFKKIYGKIKNSIKGGMAGLVYLLNDKEKSDMNFKTSDFKEKLIRKLSAQVPPGYILYPNAMNFTYDINDNILSKTPDAKVIMNGYLSAYLLKESELSDSIISKLLPDIEEKERKEIQKPNLSDLSFNFVDNDQVVSKDIENFNFELTGNLPLSWKPDGDTLKTLLASKSINNVSDIFKLDKAIVTVSVKIFPFWLKKIPEDIKNIKIIIKNS